MVRALNVYVILWGYIMNIDILCSDVSHPVNSYLLKWIKEQDPIHNIQLLRKKTDLNGGRLLLLISCHEVIDKKTRGLYNVSLVIHASDLPKGRGWSPHVWQIIEGKNEIIVTLLEAEDELDSGSIWAQEIMELEGHELLPEIDEKLFTTELKLMDYALGNMDLAEPRQQDDKLSSYYPRRTPDDSCLDPEKPLSEQFDLLRVVDSKRYPAFFDFRGHRYYLNISKAAPHEK